MNTPVDFETAKILKDKGFDEKCSHYYIDNFQNFKHDGKLHKTGLPNDWDNDNILQFVKRTNQPHLCNAPTIAEVVMWLYEKHGIWIVVNVGKPHLVKSCMFYANVIKFGMHHKSKHRTIFYNTPTEAYTDAIKYCLTKLI